jgi:hypothetical protein
MRTYKRGDIFGAPILRVAKDGKAPLLTIDPQKVRTDSIAKPETLKTLDFDVRMSSLYVAAVAEQRLPFVLKFSAVDGSLQDTFPLRDGFFPRRVGAFDSGGFIVTGTLTNREGTDSPTTELATLQYDPHGRLVGRVRLTGDLTLGQAGTGVAPDDLDRMSSSLVASESAYVYILRPTSKPIVFAIGEDGVVTRQELWSPDPKAVPVALQVQTEMAMVEFVTGLNSDTGAQTHTFVTQKLSGGEPILLSELSPDVAGAFACYDWKGGYAFVTSRAGHLALMTGRIQ